MALRAVFLIVVSLCFMIDPAFSAVVCNSRIEKTNVRAGPSAKNFDIVDSLANGVEIKLLERVTNQEGYDYLRIEFRNSRTGKPAEGFIYHEAVALDGACAIGKSAAKAAEVPAGTPAKTVAPTVAAAPIPAAAASGEMLPLPPKPFTRNGDVQTCGRGSFGVNLRNKPGMADSREVVVLKNFVGLRLLDENPTEVQGRKWWHVEWRKGQKAEDRVRGYTPDVAEYCVEGLVFGASDLYPYDMFSEVELAKKLKAVSNPPSPDDLLLQIVEADRMDLHADAFAVYKRIAAGSDVISASAARRRLAMAYLAGTGTTRDVAAAERVVEEGRKANVELPDEVHYDLAVLHLNGIGTAKDVAKAVAHLERMVPPDQEDPIAARAQARVRGEFLKALLCEQGQIDCGGYPAAKRYRHLLEEYKDAQAFVRLRALAEAGDPALFAPLGLHLARQSGLEERRAAIPYLQRAELVDSDAAARLAQYLYTGWGVAENREKALAYWEKSREGTKEWDFAADLPELVAQSECADDAVPLGRVVFDQDPDKEQLEVVASCLEVLAYRLSTQELQAEIDGKAGAYKPSIGKWSVRWAWQGAVEGLLKKGDGARATSFGEAMARGVLGEVQSSEADKEEQLRLGGEYFEKAAKVGDSDGQYWLAYMYLQGEGGKPKDLAEAEAWLRKSAAQGRSKSAVLLVKVILSDDKRSESQKIEAETWARKAAEAGDASGEGTLGMMLYEGLGVKEKDREEGIRWLRKAAAAHDKTAIEFMKESGIPAND